MNTYKSFFEGTLRAIVAATVTIVLGVTVMTQSAGSAEERAGSPSVVRTEFIYEKASFPSCHASTLVETEPGVILAAWFGGTGEGNIDVGIWASHRTQAGWSEPVEIATADGVPCWNPVLSVAPDGEVQLWYKAGKSPMSWSGLLKRSTDGGKSWSEPELLPAGIMGPIKNKPIRLDSGKLICGSSVESWRAWSCWIETSPDEGRSWDKVGPIEVPGIRRGLIQPTLFQTSSGALRMLCRATREIGYICMSESHDDGQTWSDAKPIDLPNPNSGIDAVGMKDGRVALVYNHTPRGRSPINVAISEDGGDSWAIKVTLEDQPGEYSYPAVIQSSDGLLHTTYTWKRKRIKYAVIDPAKF